MKKAGNPTLYAYEIHDPKEMTLVTAPTTRAWMDETGGRFAYRCLPLIMANTSGWLVQNPFEFSLSWNGGSKKEDIKIKFVNDRPDNRISSHFGSGILTFSLPYLFRTPKNINLWVKGPSNCPKDGIQALEGIVESDWANATFTMNWKVTRANHTVTFSKGEPICMIIPVARGLAESFKPVQTKLSDNSRLHANYTSWKQRRTDFLTKLADREEETVRQGWQKDYYKGRNAEGIAFKGHQTQIHLQEFQKL